MSRSRSLPPGANLRQLRIQAKNLGRASETGDPTAIARMIQSHPSFSRSTPAEITAAEICLANAQLVIARELGFASWPTLKKHLESLSQPALDIIHQLVIEKNFQAMEAAFARDPKLINSTALR